MALAQARKANKFSINELRRRSRSYFHRQCRIIVRNLSYKITEKKLRKEFERFGKLEEVNILKREDGKMVGSKIKQEKRNEVEEGREVFVKNLPYDVEANELKEIMSQFGLVEKVLINRERISGHSKGTAFVIFKLKDSAQLSCRQSLKLKVHDQYAEIMPALRKKDILDREKAKQEKRAKDSRNLYLLKEGLIMAGSPAAKGVSQSDMSQRLRLEQRSNEILKNFNRFVARDRLTIHNIPQSYTNEDLRNMIINFTSYRPRECRVMRDNRPSFGSAAGRSRGYGFVSFPKHEIALDVLRKLNNNPSVFGKNSRPIVSFSIEDRNVYNIRQKRLEKSRANNPTYQKKIQELQEKKAKRSQSRKETKRQTLEKLAVAPTALLQKLNPNAKPVALVPKKKQRKRDLEQMVTPFSGELSKEGKAGLRSNRKITYQADAHLQRIKDERKEGKKLRRKQEAARNRIAKQGVKRVKQKMNVNELKKEDAFFNEAIGKYKNMISQATKQPVRKKWYSE
uniref:RRM domain-containing protein n=1 Tax=Anopheles merus TaxID=30066 RepID=A0A182VMF9_ANOME